MLNRSLMALMVAGLFLSGGCRKKEEARPDRSAVPATDSEARVVRTVLAAEKEVERLMPTIGVLAARDQAPLSVKVAGRLEVFPVDVGSVVKKGDLIGQIQKRDWELKVEQARATVGAARARLGLPIEGADDSIELKDTSLVKESRATLDVATKNLERLKKLYEGKILSEAELETAESAYQVAVNRHEEALQEAANRKATLTQRRAELNIVEQQLIDTEIRAPFDGVVQERKGSLGEYLVEGAPLVTLVSIDPIRLRLEVAEREAAHVRQGQRVRFKVDGDTNVYSGVIERMSPVVAEDNRMVLVEADVRNDGRLRPGGFVRGDIVVNDKAKAVLAPKEALVTFAGIEKMFVVESGKAVERKVTTMARGNEVEVLRGVKAGEPVVLDPGTMRNGQPVVTSTSVESTSVENKKTERKDLGG